MMSGAAAPAPAGIAAADATVHKVGGRRHRGHRWHHRHGHRHGWHGGGFTFYAPVYDVGDGCYWMKRKWKRTGSRYWRKRYYRCVNRYYWSRIAAKMKAAGLLRLPFPVCRPWQSGQMRMASSGAMYL